MTPDMSRRYGLALFMALSIAVGVGLLSMPAFDPMFLLRPWLGAWLGGALLAAGALVGGHFTLRQLGRRIHPAWSGRFSRGLLWLGWALALSTWLLGLLSAQVADGRGLLWLALAPVWLAASGLWSRPARGSGAVLRPRPTERVPQRGEGVGMVQQVDVRRAGDVQLPSPGKQSVRGREDDVVAMTVDAEEQFAA
jgi:hypothetical protein